MLFFTLRRRFRQFKVRTAMIRTALSSLLLGIISSCVDSGNDAGRMTTATLETKLDQAAAECGADAARFPFDPSMREPICTSFRRPAVFFVPHPDDEALGMAGAIAEHIAAGRDVFLELMTHGEGTGVIRTLRNGGAHGWHAGTHSFTLSPSEIGDARLSEFFDSAMALGVRGVHVSDFGDGDLTQEEVDSRIDFWLSLDLDGLSLKGTVEEPRTATDSRPNPDHAIVWRALLASGHTDVRGYQVYRYSSGTAGRARDVRIEAWCDTKRAALDAYKVWAPNEGRYAIGYHSVSDLFESAQSVCTEYIVRP